MKSLRARCLLVFNEIRNDDSPFYHDDLEAFAHEMRAEGRNDGLEEAAIRLEVMADMDRNYGGHPSGQRSLRLFCAGMVRALKTDTQQEIKKEDCMNTKLLLASCEGNTLAFEVKSDDEVREIVNTEMYSCDPDKEEVNFVTARLLEDGEYRFEDGNFKLIPGGIGCAKEFKS